MRETYDALLERYTKKNHSELNDEMSFHDDLEMDSLTIAMLYPDIEETFNIRFLPMEDDMEEIFKTVGTLWEFVKLRGSL